MKYFQSVVFQISVMVVVCSGTAITGHEEELQFQDTVEIKGLEESLGHESLGHESLGHELPAEVTHHDGEGTKHATSYQSFYLESKNPVPVILKKEHHYHVMSEPDHHAQFETAQLHLADAGEDEGSHIQFEHSSHER